VGESFTWIPRRSRSWRRDSQTLLLPLAPPSLDHSSRSGFAVSPEMSLRNGHSFQGHYIVLEINVYFLRFLTTVFAHLEYLTSPTTATSSTYQPTIFRSVGNANTAISFRSSSSATSASSFSWNAVLQFNRFVARHLRCCYTKNHSTQYEKRHVRRK
jgi:hypothetical protein